MTQKFCTSCGNQVNFTSQFCNSCGTNLLNSLTGKLQADTLLDNRYIIHAMVGQGGMGAVYKAIDTRIQGRVCAVKEMSVLQLPPSERALAIQNFEQEAKLLADLHHPALPKVHDYFQEGHSGRHYLVMDFVTGDSLENLLSQRGSPFPEEQVRQWAAQLCDVLTYLHSQSPPIIFRDLNPRNIMVDPSTGDLKLIDFGIARFFKAGNSADTQAFGSPGYAPPEQYGQAQTDARSDVYSLGVAILNLLTMHDPSADPFNLPSARSLSPSVSQGLESVIYRATQTQPDLRYQTTSDMQRALLGKDVPVVGGKKTAVPWALIGGIGGVLAILLLIGLYFMMNSTSSSASPAPTAVTEIVTVIVREEVDEEIPSTAVIEEETTVEEGIDIAPAPKEEEVEEEETAVVEEAAPPTDEPPTVAPVVSNALGGGSGLIAYTAETSQSKEVFTYDMDTGNTRQLTHDSYDDYTPVWSADGRYIAYASGRNGRFDVFVIDVAASSIQNLTNGSGDNAYPSWSPTGSQLLFHSNRYGDFDVFSMNADGSNVRQLTNNDVPDLAPVWSPNGRQIAFAQSYNDRRQLAVMNSDGTGLHLITTDENYSRSHPSWSPDGQQLVFHMVTDKSIKNGLFIIDKDGNNLRQLTDSTDFAAEYSPDGEWILFHRSSGGNRTIYRIRPDGTGMTVVLDNPSDVREADWQP